MADNITGVLVCKRPYIDLSPEDAERTGSVLATCKECKCAVYAMPKNLGRGLTVLCIPCGVAKGRQGLQSGEPVVLIEGRAIGSPMEKQVVQEARKLEEELRDIQRDDNSSGD